MEDPRLEFLKSVSIDKTRVEFSDSPIVLLCGGIVPEKQRPDDPDLPISSLRHAISLESTSIEFFRPEEITDWQTDGIYQNLMDFEKDLSGICSLVVIVLESAGSIAELGAFSQLEELGHRLMVFTSSLYDENSFIKLGILRRIEKAKEGSVRTYSWPIAQNVEEFAFDKSIIDDMLGDIDDQIKTLPKSNIFKRKDTSHIIALIFQLLTLFKALKRKEIFEYLKVLGVELTDEALNQKLFLLEKFRLIVKDKYSDSTFYAAANQPFHNIRFGHEGARPFDSIRIAASCAAYYGTSNDRHRIGFLKKIATGDSENE